MITWVEFCKENEKSKNELREMVKGIRKVPGENVPDNFVKMAEDEIEKKGYTKVLNVTIKSIKEKVIVKYECDDKEELEEMTNIYGDDIINTENLTIEFKTELIKYELDGDNDLFNVLTSNEASKIYGITEGAIRSAMKTGKLKLGTDYRKAGRITLINKEAMNREYGNK